ncbi:MAG: HlyD family efflux transporter periplasmic adaptor subunit [Acetobacteraceae bacterium]|nr:HlyD family efflux transporter periplasmic adaptor subunit [Acetobacteraceae bacterium]
MRRARILLLALLAIAGAAVGAWWWRSRATDAAAWQGYVEADYVRVGPTQQGLLTSVTVNRGDRVEPGSLLFTQDEANDRAARDEAAARLAEAEARLANLSATSRETEIAQAEAELAELRALKDRAEKDRARAEALVKTGAATVQQVDQSRADALSAAARVQASEAKREQMRSPMGRQQEIAAQVATVNEARAQLAQAEWRLSQRRVVSPVTALVAEVYARPGETLAAGAPVVELLPEENILVRFFVPETALPQLRPGVPVAVGCDTCPPDLRAEISFVSPEAEYTPPVIYSESTRGKLVYLIEARPHGEKRGILKPGQPVTVRLLEAGTALS